MELEEGTRLVSNLVGVAPADVRIGMPVRLEFREFEGGQLLPQFRPGANDLSDHVAGTVDLSLPTGND